MKKRIKKKWSRIANLENKLAQLTAENMLLAAAIKKHSERFEEFQSINLRNVETTNIRFSQLESQNKALRIDIDKATFELKKPKKSWFGRK